MRCLWFYLFLQTVTAQAGFGRSYLGNSRLCHEWSCINTKLNLTDSLPSKEQYGFALKRFFPEHWQNVLDTAMNVCYGKRPKIYTNTCPGQAIMHCVMDNVIMNCPIDSLTTDSCTQLSSLAGYKYMFSQSRYENLEKNSDRDRRPSAFLRNFFHTKCCNVPQIFGEEMLKECGFEKFMFYDVHEVQTHRPGKVEFHTMIPVTSTTGIPNEQHAVNTNEVSTDESQDPLDCCDLRDFIDPAWKSDCGFQLKWDVEDRLTIINSDPVTTTTAPLKAADIKVVPVSCKEQECIFNKLNITNLGKVDKEKFAKLLDNITNLEPAWNRAKARVLSKCLHHQPLGYDSQCDINNVLGCTFDVLSENCPYENKEDNCRHSGEHKEGVICQISASKYRPKKRRQFCNIPDLVGSDVLAECGASSVYRIEYVQSKSNWSPGVSCKESTVSSNCVMNKMGVLNKYGFIDYFEMKNKIRSYSEKLTASLYDMYSTAFLSTPHYKDHCSSSKKLLNVIDPMLLTCPTQNRRKTKHCDTMFEEMKNTIANNATLDKMEEIMKHYKTYYLSTSDVSKKNVENTKKNPLYDFGILSSNRIPPVKIIDVKAKTLVLLPVYQRMKNFTIFSLNNDGVLRR